MLHKAGNRKEVPTVDAITHNNIALQPKTPSTDRFASSERIGAALEDQIRNITLLSEEQRASYSNYASKALVDIDRVSQLGLGRSFDLKPEKLGDRDMEYIFPDGTNSSEQNQSELEEKIREKEDPAYGREKKAERAANKLHSLFHGGGIESLLQGVSPNSGGARFPSPTQEHQKNEQIIDALYDIKAEDMALVKTAYEKNFGETLENEILHRFRGNVQQKLLGLVRGGAAAGGEGGEAAPKAAEN